MKESQGEKLVILRLHIWKSGEEIQMIHIARTVPAPLKAALE